MTAWQDNLLNPGSLQRRAKTVCLRGTADTKCGVALRQPLSGGAIVYALSQSEKFSDRYFIKAAQAGDNEPKALDARSKLCGKRRRRGGRPVGTEGLADNDHRQVLWDGRVARRRRDPLSNLRRRA